MQGRFPNCGPDRMTKQGGGAMPAEERVKLLQDAVTAAHLAMSGIGETMGHLQQASLALKRADHHTSSSIMDSYLEQLALITYGIRTSIRSLESVTLMPRKEG
jgi:hypothetical protein